MRHAMTRKALILVDHLGAGGTIPFVTEYARYLRNKGFECHLNGVDFEDAVSRRAVGPIELTSPRGYLRSLRFLSEISRDYAVISANSPKTLVFALTFRTLRNADATVTFTLHWPLDSNKKATFLKRRLFPYADRIHAISTSIRDILLERYRIPSERVLTFHPHVDESRFLPFSEEQRKQFRMDLELDERQPVIGFVGRLDREKNVDFLVRFANEYGTSVRPITALIYGDGPLREEILSRIQRSPGPSDVRYMGFTRVPENAFGTMDLHVLPSSFECFPLTVAQAGLSETPSLRSSVGGSKDQIDDGRTGFLFDIGQGYQAFYARLAQILEGIGHDASNFRPRLREIGRRSRKHFQEICGCRQFEMNCKRLFLEAPPRKDMRFDRPTNRGGRTDAI